MKLEHAGVSDLDEILKIFVDVKRKMADLGIRQWTADYPHETDLLADIAVSELLLIKNSRSEIVSLGTLTQTPYSVGSQRLFTDRDWFIKRLVTKNQERGKGLGASWIQACLTEYCQTGSRIYSLTSQTNQPMQKLFTKMAFNKIEEVSVDGRERFGPFYVYRKDR